MTRSFLLTLLVAISACSTTIGPSGDDARDADASEAGGGTDGENSDGGGTCPATAPTEGTSCSAPSNATCTYGDRMFTRTSCGSVDLACTNGQWQETGSSPPGPCCAGNDPSVLAANGCYSDGGSGDGGTCGTNADCPAGKVCAYDPGCTNPTRSCHDDTRGDAILITFCGCDGQWFQGVDGERYAYQPWTNEPGACAVDGANGGPACGATTCARNQVCVHPCSGVPFPDGGGPQPYCTDIPTTCNSPSCDCVRPSACPNAGDAGTSGFPTCNESAGGQLYCNGCA